MSINPGFEEAKPHIRDTKRNRDHFQKYGEPKIHTSIAKNYYQLGSSKYSRP